MGGEWTCCCCTKPINGRLGWMIVALRKSECIRVDSWRIEYVLSWRNDIFNHRGLFIADPIPVVAISVFSLAKKRRRFNIEFMASSSSQVTNLLQNNIDVSSNQLRDLLTFMRLHGIVSTCIITEVLQINNLVRCGSDVDLVLTSVNVFGEAVQRLTWVNGQTWRNWIDGDNEKNQWHWSSLTSFVRSSTRIIDSFVTPNSRGTSLFLPESFS